MAASWSLDTLTAAAHARGVRVERSQVRRILQMDNLSSHTTVLSLTGGYRML
jgi:hypothetical protein